MMLRRRMAFWPACRVNFLRGILRGNSAAGAGATSDVLDSRLLADFPKEDAAPG
jgi:hypothetical protein